MTISIDRFPVGLEMDVSYPNFQVSLGLLSATQLKFEIKEGPFARIEIVDIQVVPLGNGIFAVSWQEKDGAKAKRLLPSRFLDKPGSQLVSHHRDFRATQPLYDDAPKAHNPPLKPLEPS